VPWGTFIPILIFLRFFFVFELRAHTGQTDRVNCLTGPRATARMAIDASSEELGSDPSGVHGVYYLQHYDINVTYNSFPGQKNRCTMYKCVKLLHPYFSYTEAWNKSGLDRLDYRRDLITKNLFREIKDPKHPPITYPVKVSHSQMFCGLHTRISFHIHSYSLWMWFCTILRFSEVLNILVCNFGLWCRVIYVTDSQW